MEYSLGIDFGTTTTRVALRRGDEVPRALPIGNRGESFMPSVVAYRRGHDGTPQPFAVGEDAYVIQDTEETYAIREVKRCLCAVEMEKGRTEVPYSWWDPSDASIVLWSKKLSPQEVVYLILEEAIKRAVTIARKLDLGTLKDINIEAIRGFPSRVGCPASVGLETRKTLAQRLQHLGFSTFRISDIYEEPSLACLAYTNIGQVKPGELVLVYDLGGGTFDVSLVQIESDEGRDNAITILSVDGEPFLGGADIDKAFFEYLVEKLAMEIFGFSSNDCQEFETFMNPYEEQLLRRRTTDAKEILSDNESTNITLPAFLGPKTVNLEVTKDELESVVERLGVVPDSVECVLRAYRKARMVLRSEGEAVGSYYMSHDPETGHIKSSVFKLEHDDLKQHIQRVLLIGGSTKMPMIRKKLASLWGEDRIVDLERSLIDPIVAVATGASWKPESISAIVDRLPFSILLDSGSRQYELYDAYTPTVKYCTLRQNPSIESYRSQRFSVPEVHTPLKVTLKYPDGGIVHEQSIPSSGGKSLFLEVDFYGRCLIHSGAGSTYEITNPVQHDLQKKQLYKIEEQKRKIEEEEARRLKQQLYSNPLLEND